MCLCYPHEQSFLLHSNYPLTSCQQTFLPEELAVKQETVQILAAFVHVHSAFFFPVPGVQTKMRTSVNPSVYALAGMTPQLFNVHFALLTLQLPWDSNGAAANGRSRGCWWWWWSRHSNIPATSWNMILIFKSYYLLMRIGLICLFFIAVCLVLWFIILGSVHYFK